MIRLSIFYPTTEGKKFDKDYYLNTHMPLSLRLQGDYIKSVTVDFGVSGMPGTKPPFIAICQFEYNSVEDFEKAFNPHAETLMQDVANYTDIETVIQFSEIKLIG